MASSARRGLEQPEHLLQGWIKLEADEFSATVSAKCFQGENASSVLANLVELDKGSGSDPPLVRLDCSPEVAKEVVAVLRQGSRCGPSDSSWNAVSSLLQLQLMCATVKMPYKHSAAGGSDALFLSGNMFLFTHSDAQVHHACWDAM
jgi:hypothetical protein